MFRQAVLPCGRGFEYLQRPLCLILGEESAPELEGDVGISGILLVSALEPLKGRSSLTLFLNSHSEESLGGRLAVV